MIIDKEGKGQLLIGILVSFEKSTSYHIYYSMEGLTKQFFWIKSFSPFNSKTKYRKCDGKNFSIENKNQKFIKKIMSWKNPIVKALFANYDTTKYWYLPISKGKVSILSDKKF